MRYEDLFNGNNLDTSVTKIFKLWMVLTAIDPKLKDFDI